MRAKDLVGEKFGRLSVVQYAGSRKYKNSSVAMWKCRCECGKEVIVPGQALRQGRTKSCGCLSREIHKEILTERNKSNSSHGQFGTRIYRIWCGMKTRCYNKNHKAYRDYGGRGITICAEWKDHFEGFYKWAINNGYDDSLTIDRLDVDGNYEPSNCRWATASEQRRNQRSREKVKEDRGKIKGKRDHKIESQTEKEQAGG